MEEAPTEQVIRPTKKQYDLLVFIEKFIGEHGYSPSYREIMQGMNYTSVATVSLHVNNLVRRGHLRKRGHSARSLELTKPTGEISMKTVPKQLRESEEKWLVKKVETFFADVESAQSPSERDIDQLYVLTGALKVLGLDGAATAYTARLSEIKKRLGDNQYSV
jgi:SOS-response transcriptional repressor LexA